MACFKVEFLVRKFIDRLSRVLIQTHNKVSGSLTVPVTKTSRKRSSLIDGIQTRR